MNFGSVLSEKYIVSYLAIGYKLTSCGPYFPLQDSIDFATSKFAEAIAEDDIVL